MLAKLMHLLRNIIWMKTQCLYLQVNKGINFRLPNGLVMMLVCKLALLYVGKGHYAWK